MTDEDRLRPAPGVVAAAAADGVVLNDEAHGRIHVLNESAARVWELCGQGLTTAAIAERLAASYGLGADAVREDVEAVLHDLRDRGVLLDGSGR